VKEIIIFRHGMSGLGEAGTFPMFPWNSEENSFSEKG
jgi:hypothetical protein